MFISIAKSHIQSLHFMGLNTLAVNSSRGKKVKKIAEADISLCEIFAVTFRTKNKKHKLKDK